MASSADSQSTGQISIIFHVVPRDDGTRSPSVLFSVHCDAPDRSIDQREAARTFAEECLQIVRESEIGDDSVLGMNEQIELLRFPLSEILARPPDHLRLGRLQLSSLGVNVISGCTDATVRLALDSDFKLTMGQVIVGEADELNDFASTPASRAIWNEVSRAAREERSLAERRGSPDDVTSLCSAVNRAFPIGVPSPTLVGGARYVLSRLEVWQLIPPFEATLVAFQDDNM